MVVFLSVLPSGRAMTPKRVFISHSWKNKPLARRIARRLAHHGVDTWIDEASLQAGDRLSEKLATEIRQCSHFVVLLSTTSLASKWVTQEIEVAKAAGALIIPLISEPDLTSPLLDESLGLDIINPLHVEDRLADLARIILDEALQPTAKPALLRQHLESIAVEAPELRTLITQLANKGQLTIAQLNATKLTEQTRHSAETALLALYELSDEEVRYPISLVAAHFYRNHGIGYEVLKRQIFSANENHLHTMFSHLADVFQRPEDFDGAFILFGIGSQRQDQAFANFVRANFDAFSEGDRTIALHLMLTPERGPQGFAIDAAYELYARMPQSRSLRDLWWFWVNDYKFGGRREVEETQRATVFFSTMNQSLEKGLQQFGPIMDHFETCFRGLARGRPRDYLDDLDGAVSLLKSAADAKYVHRRALARQLNDAFYSAEWNDRPHRELLHDAVTDFAKAVANDERYHDALSAYTHAFISALDRDKNNTSQ